MKSFLEGLKLAFTCDPKVAAEPADRQYLNEDEKNVLMLTAEGNVFLSMGEVCTPEEVEDARQEVLRHVS